jgi:hypothetical protein
MGSNAEPRLLYTVQADSAVLTGCPALVRMGWERETERVPPDNAETIVLRYFMPPLLSLRSGGVLTIEENLVAIVTGDGRRWRVNCAALSAHDRRYVYPRTIELVGSEAIVKQETEDALRTLGYTLPEAIREAAAPARETSCQHQRGKQQCASPPLT